MLLSSYSDINHYNLSCWLYVDAYKIDSDISTDVVRYRRVVHSRWPLSPNYRHAAAAIDTAIEYTKRKQNR